MIKKEEKLEGVDDRLVRVVRLAATKLPFDLLVVEGLRTKERQAQLVRAGASQTMNSFHLTGHAVDLAPMLDGKLHWDWPLFYPLARAMKEAAAELGVKLTWGGDWKKFKDGPHFQVPRA